MVYLTDEQMADMFFARSGNTAWPWVFIPTGEAYPDDKMSATVVARTIIEYGIERGKTLKQEEIMACLARRHS